MGLETLFRRVILSNIRKGRGWSRMETVAFVHSQPDSESDKPKAHVLPPLMDYPITMWPSLVNTFKNWFFVYFVIKPYMDKEFDMKEFDRGAKQAVSLVSNKLVKGEFEDLEGLVDSEALEKLKSRVSSFSMFQRQLLGVEPEDIFFSFPYQIGVIIPDETPESDRLQGPQSRPHQAGWIEPQTKGAEEYRPPQKRFVEITVVLHVLRGFREKSEKGEMRTLQEFIRAEDTRNNVMVCNYRFFRDFTDGVNQPNWIINMVNQFLPADHQKQ